MSGTFGIGRKLLRSSVSKPLFFRSGVTPAVTCNFFDAVRIGWNSDCNMKVTGPANKQMHTHDAGRGFEDESLVWYGTSTSSSANGLNRSIMEKMVRSKTKTLQTFFSRTSRNRHNKLDLWILLCCCCRHTQFDFSKLDIRNMFRKCLKKRSLLPEEIFLLGLQFVFVSLWQLLPPYTLLQGRILTGRIH